MIAGRTLKNALSLAIVLALPLALLPCTADAGMMAFGPSASSHEGAPLLLAQSSKRDALLVPPPEPSLPQPEAAAPAEKKPSPMAEMSQDDEGGVSGGEAQVEEAKSKAAKDYSGPLGGLGISCEDQKDLQALALGTYGNLLKAVTNSPGVVNCASDTGKKDGSPAPSGKEGGKPKEGG